MFCGENTVCIKECGENVFKTLYELGLKGDKKEYEVLVGNKFQKMKIKTYANHKSVKIITSRNEELMLAVSNDLLTSNGILPLSDVLKSEEKRYLYVWLEGDEEDSVNLVPIMSIEPFESKYANMYGFILNDKSKEHCVIMSTLRLSDVKEDKYHFKDRKKQLKKDGKDSCVRGLKVLL